jgi:hypothetical protein
MPTYAHTTYTTAAATFEYAIGFSYARTDDVKVYLDSGSGEVEIARGSATNQWVYSTSGTKITLGSTVGQGDGDTLRMSRVTDISDAAAVFTDGSGITDDDLNLAINQLLYAIDELQVPAWEYNETMTTVVAGGDITAKTNLGTTLPTRVQVWLECLDTDAGYSVNNWVLMESSNTPLLIRFLPTSPGYCIISDREATAFTVPHVSTGVDTAIDDSKWRLHIRAWR